MKKYNRQDLASLTIAGLLLVIGLFTVGIISFGMISGVDQVQPEQTAAINAQDFNYDEYIRAGKSYFPEDLNAIEPAAGGEKQRHIQLFEDTLDLQTPQDQTTDTLK